MMTDVHVPNPQDDWIAANMPDRVLRILGLIGPQEMIRMADGVLNMMILIDREFERRFPVEYRSWAARNDVE